MPDLDDLESSRGSRFRGCARRGRAVRRAVSRGVGDRAIGSGPCPTGRGSSRSSCSGWAVPASRATWSKRSSSRGSRSRSERSRATDRSPSGSGVTRLLSPCLIPGAPKRRSPRSTRSSHGVRGSSRSRRAGLSQRSAAAHGLAHVAIPAGLQPRASLGYLTLPILAVLVEMGLVPDCAAGRRRGGQGAERARVALSP